MVRTVDALRIEKYEPSDVLSFDRRCHECTTGRTTTFSCIASKDILYKYIERGRIYISKDKTMRDLNILVNYNVLYY